MIDEWDYFKEHALYYSISVYLNMDEAFRMGIPHKHSTTAFTNTF